MCPHSLHIPSASPFLSPPPNCWEASVTAPLCHFYVFYFHVFPLFSHWNSIHSASIMLEYYRHQHNANTFLCPSLMELHLLHTQETGCMQVGADIFVLKNPSVPTQSIKPQSLGSLLAFLLFILELTTLRSSSPNNEL